MCFNNFMKLKQRTDLTVREIDGETLILDRRCGNIHQLNVTASLIWRHSNGETPTEDIITGVAARFNAPSAMITEDIHSAIRRFQELGLLEEQQT